jgi:hypothetical protein
VSTMSGSTPGHHRRHSKLEVGPSACGVRASAGSSCREQAFFDSVETFPCGFGQRWVGSNDIADHLPGGQIERALGRGAHRQRNGTLRAEANPLRGRFLARLHAHGLREQVHGHRFLSGFEFPTTAKTIQVIQESVSGWTAMILILTILSPTRCRWHKYVEGFRQTGTSLGGGPNQALL